MGTKIDEKWAQGILESVNALILEVKRLESLVNEYESRKVTEVMINRFLGWQLPKSVCADPCASMPGYTLPRSGTCLLTYDEAKQMLEYVLGAP